MAGRTTPSYTPTPTLRHLSPPQRRIASTVGIVLALAVPIGGCASIVMPLSALMGSSAPPPEDVTGSIPRPAAAVPAQAESDGEMIRRRVEEAAGGIGGGPLEWRNPASGHSGTITTLVPSKARNGASCRDFETTMATIEGVRLYRGRACQGYAGPWDLVRLEAADA